MQRNKILDMDTVILEESVKTKKKKKKRLRYFEPQKPIPKSLYFKLTMSSFILLLGIWSLLTYTNIVDALFLPTPTSIITSGITLFTQFNFINDIFVTFSRVLVGFGLALLIGVPLGIFVGSYKVVEAFFEPIISFVRYMPVSAFIPLFILWIGVGELEKISVIFFGSIFSIVLMVAVEVSGVRRELLEAAYTLGSSNIGVLRSVILPASMPGILDAIRLVLGWAWSYIIVAELIATASGIGSVIIESQRMFRIGNIIFGILTIGMLGLLSDLILKFFGKKMFSWNYGR
ncbi:ABC transporter permease [Peribacillus sp. NPDC097295]|uniref:ABC transporter permease n=1 Tax=Peribacillus sp. NPDC097295 TaxID=3364402 RepID=UPI003829A9ED